MAQGATVQAVEGAPAGYWLFMLGKLYEADKESVLANLNGHLIVYTSEEVAKRAKGKYSPFIPLPSVFLPWNEICRRFGGKSFVVDWYPGAEGRFTPYRIPQA